MIRRSLGRRQGIALVLALAPAMLWAQEIPPGLDGCTGAGKPVRCLGDLQHLGPQELAALFCQAPCGSQPVGCFRGRVLYVIDARHPQHRARMQGLLWKGKCFEPDGDCINQWAGFQALHAQAEVGSSWLDGAPCIVLHYAPGTPLFGNARDELRQMAPGLYLGLMWEKEPCPHLKSYFALQQEATHGRNR